MERTERQRKANILYNVGLAIMVACLLQMIGAILSGMPILALVGFICGICAYFCCKTNDELRRR